MPLLGRFDLQREKVVFRGEPIPLPPNEQPIPAPAPPTAFGILVADQRVVNGTLRGEIEFADVTPESVCEFILGYDLKSKNMLSAGLGGNHGMFSIRSFVQLNPPQQG